MDNFLYIGIRGLARSGKDTVTEMLKCLLSMLMCDCNNHYEFYNSEEECYKAYKEKSYVDSSVHTIAFADPLKKICSILFNVPLEYFYIGSRTDSWVCINGDFEYTHTQPTDGRIVTSAEYAAEKFDCKCWMNLREIMVYVGTEIMQKHFTKNVFVNLISKEAEKSNKKFFIVSDVRFRHEYEFIKEHGGIVLNVTNSRVVPMDNVAEKELTDNDIYDMTIVNDGTLEDLFISLYNCLDSVSGRKIFKLK